MTVGFCDDACFAVRVVPACAVDASRACRGRRVFQNDGLALGSAVVMPLLETNPPRSGGPLYPPAQENVTVGFLAIMDDSL